MANSKITGLPAAGALTGVEPLPVVQSAATKQSTISAILTYITANISLAASAITSGALALARGGTGASLADPGADRLLFWDDSAGNVDWLTAGSGLTIAGTTITAAGGGDDFICIWDQKATGTAGGTFTSGAWRTRDLNTEQADAGGYASVASNQITLAAGTYRCRIIAPAFYVGSHQARLRDITNTANILIGTPSSAEASSVAGTVTHSVITGRFTLAGSTVLEVQHQCGTTKATNGLGGAANFGEIEIYTVAEFWRER